MGVIIGICVTMELIALIILFAFGVAAIQAECPPVDSVPVMHPLINDTFNCARKYSGPGDAQPIQGCNTCSYGGDDYVFDAEDGYDYPDGGFLVGSLIVNPGCTFYGFQYDNYEGDVYTFTAGLHSLVNAPNPDSAFSDCAYGYP